jgi:excinuclease ABC subunit A
MGLKIEGAKDNNLKNINLELPHDCLIAISGLSGSGKSTLAFDTIYAEGQRRYIETFSSYTRQFFDKVKRPNATRITGVRPAIAIEQRTRIKNSRSTVGSLTNINEYLKAIYSNLGKPSCPKCGKELARDTPESAAKKIERLISDEIALLCVETKKSKIELEALGLSRALESGELIFLEDAKSQPIVVVLERLTKSNFKKERARDSVALGYSLGKVKLILKDQEHHFFNDFFCECSDLLVSRPRPALFSYNHPYGACERCKGFGYTLSLDLKKAIPDDSKSIKDGAIQIWMGKAASWERKQLVKYLKERGVSEETPWADLPKDVKDHILYEDTKSFCGIVPWFLWMEKKSYKMHVRVFLSRYRSQVVCDSCNGTRLKPEAQAFKINGKTISDLWSMPIQDLLSFIKDLPETPAKSPLLQRVKYLELLGLSYLTLDRQARTLSGGETQRVNLAAALGTDLTGAQFVLDEPSVGLHSQDTEKLIVSLRELTDKGNSVVVVEHDRDTLFSSDHLITLGPKAGSLGGEVTFQGDPSDYDKKLLDFTEKRVEGSFKDFYELKNAKSRNLKNVSVSIPKGSLTCLVGVSGSGKSTLVEEEIVKAFDAELVDQTPLSKTPRANIATYTKIWDTVRDLLAQTEGAKKRGLSKSSFSFNVSGGRCPSCKGAGFVREDMQFLSDVFIPCEVCLGKRFQGTVLEVLFEGKNVDDLLKLSVDDAIELFKDHNKILESLSVLSKLGLGHLSLGHPLSELSGGEAQRLKLVPFIKERGHLLIFDEPTTGLHVKDVERLYRLFRSLKGNTILCVEHNLDLISVSDWIIELGPVGGENGGYKIFEGTVEELLKADTPTARALNKKFEKPKRKVSRKKENALIIKGAKEHNLKNIDVKIPFNKIVTITGASGSGKSTIAKDIIFAEGQRQYLECLSPYARQFIKELKKAEVESIENLKPTICVHQHTFQPGKLSTIGTLSEAYSFLRLLYSKVGTQYCAKHPDQAISEGSTLDIARTIKSTFRENVRILAPMIKERKGFHRELFGRAISAEISEVRVDGIFISPRLVSYDLDRNKDHSIDFVVAKCNPSQVDLDILKETIDQGVSLSGGEIVVVSGKEEFVFSTERACPKCNRGYLRPDPEDFSFSSKRGACKKCKGEGINKKGEKCPACNGSRLGTSARYVRVGGLLIENVVSIPIKNLLTWVKELELPDRLKKVATPIIEELASRVETLCNLGLGDLSLGRSCSTLSGGELQRVRLATALGSPLSGVMYIFDEPSIGLHPLDNKKVLAEFYRLRQTGNSVLIIEHDPQTILASDYIIDVGPGGGKNGGEIVFSGETKDLIKSNSPTAIALKEIEPIKTEIINFDKFLKVRNANKNNLVNFNVDIPLRALTVIGGVSGAGKSSLVHGVIGEGKYTSDIEIKDMLFVDQKPIGANARSTPASYLGIWDHIRSIFSEATESKARGYTASFFSYNSGKGRCPECKGLGYKRLEMSFLPDAVMECELCTGDRFSDEAKEIYFKGLNISDVLKLTFEEAKDIFVNFRKIHKPIHFACELGLGYLTLGQHANTVSGGESQRLKLVRELTAPDRDHILYLLDEPTTGLHRADIGRLLSFLKQFVAKGHTVIMIEHDDLVIKSADHFIELDNGKVVFEGHPSLVKGTPWGELLAA